MRGEGEPLGWGRLVAVIGIVGLLSPLGGGLARAGVTVEDASQAVPAAQDEFVPIDELPPEDRLPAAPLLIVAYAIAWIVVLAYLWSIWRRLARVEQDLADVSRRQQRPREG